MKALFTPFLRNKTKLSKKPTEIIFILCVFTITKISLLYLILKNLKKDGKNH